jgi:hypothetical protein
VPWISDSEKFGTTDPDRHADTMRARLCQVCGHRVDDDEEAWLFVNESEVPEDRDGLIALAMDDAILHPCCARLTLEHCPVVRSLFANRQLTVLKALGADVEVVYDHGPDSDGQTPRHSVDLVKAHPA